MNRTRTVELLREADEVLVRSGALDQARAVRDELARLRETILTLNEEQHEMEQTIEELKKKLGMKS